MTDIALVAVNAKYAHTAFGLRYLLANLGPLQNRASLHEFTIQDAASDVVEHLVRLAPRVVGIGVYVWNADLVGDICRLLARVAPEVVIVLGGPEVSFELDANPLVPLADYVIPGEAEDGFRALTEAILDGDPPTPGVLPATLPDLATLRLPYGLYGDEDVAHRIVYVEASRGCPFRCEFCLSSLDEKVRTFPLEPFLTALAELHDRGVRHFKFVDRTFNLDLKRSTAILEFFADRVTPDLLLHFELIPDRLPAALREVIPRFPPGCLQFEVGIQTLDDAVSTRIQRQQNVGRLTDNLRWLAEATGAHVHADLIVGLPGETLAQFGAGFDQLYALGVAEIQIGILKRLRGTPIARHQAAFGMEFDPSPPYQVLATQAVPFLELQEMRRLARYWDLVANSGHYARILELLLDGSSPFAGFRELSAFLYGRFRRAHHIAAPHLARALFDAAVELRGQREAQAAAALIEDHLRGGRLQIPEFLRPHLTPADYERIRARRKARGNPAARRQRARQPAPEPEALEQDSAAP